MLEHYDLQSGKSAAAFSGLYSDDVDAGTRGFHVGLSQLFANSYWRAQELDSALSFNLRNDDQCVQWLPCLLTEDQMLPVDACTHCPEACEFGAGWLHPAPATLTSCASIQSDILSAVRCETDSVKVLRANGQSFFHFAHNPFDDTGWYVRVSRVTGREVRKIDAWLYLPKLDAQYSRRFLSPITGLSNVPVPVQHAAMQCRIDPSNLNFRVLLGAITGSPVSVHHDTVLDVLPAMDGRSACVITQIGTYHGGSGVSPLVTPQQTLQPGDLLFDGFSIAELAYETPTWTNALRVPGVYLGNAVPHIDLSFAPTSVVIESSTRATFSVGTHSVAYWDYAYGQSDELSEALFESLAGRSSVSPFQFFQEHSLRYGSVAVLLRGDLISDAVSAVRRLREFLPAYRALFLDISDPIPDSLLGNPPPCCAI